MFLLHQQKKPKNFCTITQTRTISSEHSGGQCELEEVCTNDGDSVHFPRANVFFTRIKRFYGSSLQPESISCHTSGVQLQLHKIRQFYICCSATHKRCKCTITAISVSIKNIVKLPAFQPTSNLNLQLLFERTHAQAHTLSLTRTYTSVLYVDI